MNAWDRETYTPSTRSKQPLSKIAVVAGGAGGIGQAFAGRLAKENQTIVLIDLSEEAGKEVVAGFLGK